VKEKPGIKTNDLTKKGVGVINRNLVIFSFFLFLSFVLWYLNSLGKIIEADIRYPVKYINLPKEKVFAEETPVNFFLFLKGTGYSIIKLKLSENKVPVIIDLSKVPYRRVPGSSELNYFIVTSGLTKSLAIQLRSGCEITSIKPDTLFFTLDKAGSKSVDNIPESRVFKIRK
jgi:hypothetical protein